jgi:hypothetical protein
MFIKSSLSPADTVAGFGMLGGRYEQMLMESGPGNSSGYAGCSQQGLPVGLVDGRFSLGAEFLSKEKGKTREKDRRRIKRAGATQNGGFPRPFFLYVHS